MAHIKRLCKASVVLLAAAVAAPAKAHPHVWISARTAVLYENGTFTGLKHTWVFDEFYTAMAIEGLDKNKDGIYDREELAELAKVNIDGLKEFSYFTFATLGGRELKLAEPRDYWLEHKDGVLSLHFVMPFATPVLTDAKGLAFSVFDPTFFIAFEWAKTEPVALGAGAPKVCKASIGAPPAQGNDAATALGNALTKQFGGTTMSVQKMVSIDCGGP